MRQPRSRTCGGHDSSNSTSWVVRSTCRYVRLRYVTTTCGRAKGVDGVNIPRPRSGERRCHPARCGSGRAPKFAVRKELAASGHER